MVDRWEPMDDSSDTVWMERSAIGNYVTYADHEQALAEIERKNVDNLAKIDEEHERDLAEKDREYQHLMAQAIRFAQYYDNAGVDVERLKEVQAFLKEHP